MCFNNQQKLGLFAGYFRFIGTCTENENFVPQTKSKISTIGSSIIKKKPRFLEKINHSMIAKVLIPSGLLKGCWRLKAVIVLCGLNIYMGQGLSGEPLSCSKSAYRLRVADNHHNITLVNPLSNPKP